MKKLIALTLALILCFTMIIPVSASDSVYMIFDCDTDDGCGSQNGFSPIHWGPVGENAEFGFPAPVQGDCSYCIYTESSQLSLFNTLSYTTGTFDATQYDYIELDVYSDRFIVFDWSFGLATDTADPAGARWGMESAVLYSDTWTHIKMPISEFGEFTESFPGSMDNINRIMISMYDIVEFEELRDNNELVTPNFAYIYFDNVVATKDDAGSDNELFDFDKWIIDYPPVPPAPEVLYGDATLDGEVTPRDSLSVLQYSVGKVVFDYLQYENADVNGDGEVNSTDSLFILQYAIGKATCFPIELPSTYMLYDCEDSEGTTDNSFNPLLTGPVEEDAFLGHPAPVQGSYSYCVNTHSDSIYLSHNMPDSIDLTYYDYIELDVYSSKDIIFNWMFNICTETADAQGSTWGMSSAWMPEDRWYHIKMPISAFGAFSETFGGNINDINRIGLQITNIVLTDDLMEGDFVTPDYVYIYFDNIVATKDGAGSDNELIDFDTVMNDPPDWYEEYLYNKRTCGGGLKGPDEY